jgi:hypothetical protein
MEDDQDELEAEEQNEILPTELDLNSESTYTESVEGPALPPTVEILATFKQFKTSPQLSGTILNQEVLIALFSRYGDVLNVVIKKLTQSTGTGFPRGYCFVHYPDTPEGYESSLLAVRSLQNADVDGVNYRCLLSHKLEAHLAQLNYNFSDLKQDRPPEQQQQPEREKKKKKKGKIKEEKGKSEEEESIIGETEMERQRRVIEIIDTSRLSTDTQGLLNREAGTYWQTSSSSTLSSRHPSKYRQGQYPPLSHPSNPTVYHSSPTNAQLMRPQAVGAHPQVYSTSSLNYGAAPAPPTRYAPLRQGGGPTYDPSVHTRGAVVYRGVIQPDHTYIQHTHPQSLQQPLRIEDGYGDRYVHSHGHGGIPPQYSAPTHIINPSSRPAVVDRNRPVSPPSNVTQSIIMNERYYQSTEYRNYRSVDNGSVMTSPEYHNPAAPSAYAMSSGMMYPLYANAPYGSPPVQYSVRSMGGPHQQAWHQYASRANQGHSRGQQQQFNPSYANATFVTRRDEQYHHRFYCPPNPDGSVAYSLHSWEGGDTQTGTALTTSASNDTTVTREGEEEVEEDGEGEKG